MSNQCEYCQGGPTKPRKSLIDDEECFDLFIDIDPLSKTIELQCTYFEHSFPIKFCPMCGDSIEVAHTASKERQS